MFKIKNSTSVVPQLWMYGGWGVGACRDSLSKKRLKEKKKEKLKKQF